MEIFDFSEERSLIGMYLDNLDEYGLTRQDISGYDDEEITLIEEDIKNGVILYKGQVLMIKSTYGDEVLGNIPVIVNNITRINSSEIQYGLVLLTGDFNDELSMTTTTNIKLKDIADVNSDIDNVVDAILESKMGCETLYELQVKLGIDKLVVLKKLDNKVITYM